MLILIVAAISIFMIPGDLRTWLIHELTTYGITDIVLNFSKMNGIASFRITFKTDWLINIFPQIIQKIQNWGIVIPDSKLCQFLRNSFLTTPQRHQLLPSAGLWSPTPAVVVFSLSIHCTIIRIKRDKKDERQRSEWTNSFPVLTWRDRHRGMWCRIACEAVGLFVLLVLSCRTLRHRNSKLFCCVRYFISKFNFVD